MKLTLSLLLMIAGLLFGSLSLPAATAKWEADAVLATAGLKSGLCIHLGCGSKKNPALAADLAARGGLLVHGVALDDASLQRARQAIEAQGMPGRAMAEKLSLKPLPYLPDLANLVVIEDWSALAAQGLDMEEVERVTAPGGIICVHKEGRWTKTAKARPSEMDEWPQPAHGPDGNRVSTDRLVKFPVGLRWQDGVPMNFSLWAACRGWVVANGRCFTLSTTEPENLGPASFSKHKLEEYVMARDAFNGLPLWKVNCETTNEGKSLNANNTAPLVTDGQRVYVYKKDRLAALDAATGQVVMGYPVKYQTVRLVLLQNVLVASGWEAKVPSKDFAGDGLWAPWANKTAAGAVEAFDAQKGTLKWSVSSPAQDLVAADGLAYLLLQSGNPATNQEVLAVDLQTGQERWRVAHTNFAEAVAMNLTCAGQGVVVVARQKAKTVSILSSADGKVLWEIKPADKFWTPLVEGELWHGHQKYEPKTGAVKGKLPAGLDSPVCTPAAVVGTYVTASRGCSYIDLYPSSEGGTQQGAKWINYGGARGGCIEGATPANGMFYTGQNFCRCAPGQVPGFVAFGPCGDVPRTNDFQKERPVEKGLAFGKVKESAATEHDWPMHRHDAERSGAAKVELPQNLKLLWQSEATRPPSGPLAAAWQARLASCLSSPVCAEGMVFAAATDGGQIVALQADTGAVVWRSSVGGRVDTPPTVHQGLCLFGSHDGWVYALRARDGQLAWRTRIAPWERRMMSFGQIESVWPAHGSVLVHDGTVFASAGRTTESDGGLAVCALDLSTGQQRWARQIGPGPVRENDLLVVREGSLLLHYLQLDPKTGQVDLKAKGPKDDSLEGLIDGTWTRMGTRRSGNLKFGRVTAELFAWNDKTVFGYASQGRSCFAITRENTGGTNKLTQQDYLWRLPMPAQHQVEAMAVAENGLLLAGRVCDPKTEEVKGFLWFVTFDTGKKEWEQALETPPVYDGLALARQHVYLTLQNGKALCFGKAEL
jgi:outer membrane protein assembly factor BamB